MNRDGSPGNGVAILGDSFEGNAQSFRIVARLSFRKLITGGVSSTARDQLDRERSAPSVQVSDDDIESLSDEDLKAEADRPDSEQSFTGLNLTWETLFAIQKYPWIHDSGPPSAIEQKKWGFYYSERDYFDEMLRRYPYMADEGSRSINAQIMDWADDVAYAIHDTEDFFRAGLIPLDRLKHDTGEWIRFREFAKEKSYRSILRYYRDASEAASVRDELRSLVVDVLEQIFGVLPDFPFDGSRLAHAQLHRFATRHIEWLTQDVTLQSPVQLKVPLRIHLMAEILKSLTQFYVIRTPNLFTAQIGHRRIVRELFFDLWNIVRNDRSFGNGFSQGTRIPNTILPARLWELCEHAVTDESMVAAGTRDGRLARAVVDFLCTLTDKQASLLNDRLAGNLTTNLSSNWLTL